MSCFGRSWQVTGLAYYVMILFKDWENLCPEIVTGLTNYARICLQDWDIMSGYSYITDRYVKILVTRLTDYARLQSQDLQMMSRYGSYNTNQKQQLNHVNGKIPMKISAAASDLPDLDNICNYCLLQLPQTQYSKCWDKYTRENSVDHSQTAPFRNSLIMIYTVLRSQ